MEAEHLVPRKLSTPAVADTDRERAAELLQQACGEGRLTLDEFSARVGAVWAAEDQQALAEATGGLAAPPPVGTSQPVSVVSATFGEHKQKGRWRLPRALAVRVLFGAAKLDLREAMVGPDAVADGAVDIQVKVRFGEVKILVPEGVEVELYGRAVFGSRSLRLAPVPRRIGTPVVRVHARVAFGELKVSSAPPGRTGVAHWLDDIFD